MNCIYYLDHNYRCVHHTVFSNSLQTKRKRAILRNVQYCTLTAEREALVSIAFQRARSVERRADNGRLKLFDSGSQPSTHLHLYSEFL